MDFHGFSSTLLDFHELPSRVAVNQRLNLLKSIKIHQNPPKHPSVARRPWCEARELKYGRGRLGSAASCCTASPVDTAFLRCSFHPAAQRSLSRTRNTAKPRSTTEGHCPEPPNPAQPIGPPSLTQHRLCCWVTQWAYWAYLGFLGLIGFLGFLACWACWLVGLPVAYGCRLTYLIS